MLSTQNKQTINQVGGQLLISRPHTLPCVPLGMRQFNRIDTIYEIACTEPVRHRCV